MLGLVVTGIVSDLQGSGQVGGGDRFWLGDRCARNHIDPVLSEESLGALAYSAGDDDIGTLLVQPSRQHARFVRRRSQKIRAHNGLRCLIDLENRELFTMAEMHAQLSVGGRDGEFHSGGFFLGCWECGGIG